MGCAYSGFMSFGEEDGEERGYDVRLFRDPSGIDPDGLGVVAPSSLPPRAVSFSSAEEILAWEDYDDELRQAIPLGSSIAEDDFDERNYPGLIHVRRCKVGGWPSWVQHPKWPHCDRSGRMFFVGQLDWDLGRETVWAPGGYAYLFACPESCSRRHGELVIQTT